MPSFRIPISPAIVDAFGLNTAAPVHRLRISHLVTDDGRSGVVVLTSVNDWTASPRREGCFITHVDAAGAVRQHPLMRLNDLLQKYELTPVSFQTFGPRVVVGASIGVSLVPIRCGLFLGDWTQDAFRFLPNCGSRISVRSPEIVYGTLHHNHEGRHYPISFDDAVCRYENFNPSAADVPGLGPVRMVAHLRPASKVDFPGLLPVPVPSPFAAKPGYGDFTDSIEPLPDGRVVVSIWDTAQNALEDYYFVILSRDGQIDATIRGIEKRARLAFSDRLGLLVAIGETTSQLIDLAGNIVENVPHPPRTKSVFRRFPFAGIGRTSGARFISSPLVDDQTNSLLVVPEPGPATGGDYLRSLHQALVDHDKWVRIEAKARGPTFFRWTE